MSSNNQSIMLNNLGLELSRGIWYRIRNIKYDILINGVHYNRFRVESVTPGMSMFKKEIYIPIVDNNKSTGLLHLYLGKTGFLFSQNFCNR